MPHSRTLRFVTTTTVAVTCLVSAPAGAQNAGQLWYTWQPIPLGGRTAAMGGAGAAFGFDSAMPLLNPAGLARVDQHHISMSATAYSLHAVDVPHFYTTGGRDPMYNDPSIVIPPDSMHSQTVDVFPTGFVYSWPLGAPAGEPNHHVISLSILTPRRYTMEYTGTFGLEIAGSRLDEQFSRAFNLTGYYIGPSYAVQALPWLRAGVAAMLLYHRAFSTSTIIDRNFVGVDSVLSTSSGSWEGYSLGFVPVLGLQVMPVKNFHIGLSVQIESIPLTGSVEQNGSSELSASQGAVLDRMAEGTSTVYNFRLKTSDFRILSPTMLTFGIGYEAPRKWAIAADVHYVLGFGYDFYKGIRHETNYVAGRGSTVSQVEDTVPVYADPVFNFNVGGEVFVTDWLALRTGAFSDFSPNPEIVDNETSNQQFNRKINMFGGSLGLGFFFGPVDFNVGVVYAGGTGKYGAVRNLLGSVSNPDPNNKAADATESRLMAIVTGGVSFGEALAPVNRHARELEAVIAPTPAQAAPPIAQPPPAPPQVPPSQPPAPQPPVQPGIYQYPATPPQPAPQPQQQPPAPQPQQYQPAYYPPGYSPPPQEYSPPPPGYYYPPPATPPAAPQPQSQPPPGQ